MEDVLMQLPWGGLTCCLGGLTFYFIGKSYQREVDFLKSVTRVKRLKDLVVGKVLPKFVSVSGRVGSDTPITCPCSGAECVILKETAEQHFLKKYDKGTWVNDKVVMLSTVEYVPWYLDDGTARAFVTGVRSASEFYLTVANEVFEKSGPSIDNGTPDKNEDIKMLGVKRFESVLETGTSLMVVGKAVKDDGGNIRIRQPLYASRQSIDQIIDSYSSSARWNKNASMGLTIIGLFFLTKYAVKYIRKRMRCYRETRKRILDDAAAKKYYEDNIGQYGSDFTGNDKCVVCFEHDYNSVFVPCGHMCCCLPCSSQLNICPLCRRQIDQVVRTFRR